MTEMASGNNEKPWEDTINPLVPKNRKIPYIAKILFIKKEGIGNKISYERRVYESVDDRSPS